MRNVHSAHPESKNSVLYTRAKDDTTLSVIVLLSKQPCALVRESTLSHTSIENYVLLLFQSTNVTYPRQYFPHLLCSYCIAISTSFYKCVCKSFRIKKKRQRRNCRYLSAICRGRGITLRRPLSIHECRQKQGADDNSSRLLAAAACV